MIIISLPYSVIIVSGSSVNYTYLLISAASVVKLALLPDPLHFHALVLLLMTSHIHISNSICTVYVRFMVSTVDLTLS